MVCVPLKNFAAHAVVVLMYYVMNGGQLIGGIPAADLAGAANSEVPFFSIGMVSFSSPGWLSSGLKLGNSSDGGVTSSFHAVGEAASHSTKVAACAGCLLSVNTG